MSELADELDNGVRLATALVDHLTAMGNAGACTIPVLDRAEEYVVRVEPKAYHDRQAKIVDDMRTEIRKTWAAARSCGNERDTFNLFERMTDRLGYGRTENNPPLV